MDDDIDVAAMDPETLVRMGCIQTLNQGNIDATKKFYTADATYYRSEDEPLSLSDLIEDAERFKAAFPDIEATIDEVLVADDGQRVTFRYTVRGTHQGQYGDLPPTGEQFERQGVGFAVLEDGRIDEYSVVFDRLGMLEDLGVF